VPPLPATTTARAKFSTVLTSAASITRKTLQKKELGVGTLRLHLRVTPGLFRTTGMGGQDAVGATGKMYVAYVQRMRRWSQGLDEEVYLTL
jgi:hypothetical protein